MIVLICFYAICGMDRLDSDPCRGVAASGRILCHIYIVFNTMSGFDDA